MRALHFIPLLTLLYSASAFSAQAMDSCRDRLDPDWRARQVVHALSQALEGRTENISGRVARIDLNGGTIARLRYALKLPHTMVIEFTEVDPQYQRKGYNRLLTAEALIAEPGTTRLEATLAWTNASLFFDAVNRHTFWNRLFHSGRVNRKALESTPFYRVAHEMGFGKIVSLEVRDEVIDLVLERSDERSDSEDVNR